MPWWRWSDWWRWPWMTRFKDPSNSRLEAGNPALNWLPTPVWLVLDTPPGLLALPQALPQAEYSHVGPVFEMFSEAHVGITTAPLVC